MQSLLECLDVPSWRCEHATSVKGVTHEITFSELLGTGLVFFFSIIYVTAKKLNRDASVNTKKSFYYYYFVFKLGVAWRGKKERERD